MVLKNEKKIIVTGGRDFYDSALLNKTLDFINPDVVVEGGALGADRLALEWAHNNNKKVITVKALWSVNGKAAGPLRNGEMLRSHPDAILVAFPGGRGTANCVRQAKEMSRLVFKVE